MRKNSIYLYLAFFTLLFALLLCKTEFEVEAAVQPSIFGGEEVEVKPGEQVKVPVMIENNSGLAGWVLDISYDDSLLTPLSVERGSAFPEGNLDDNIEGDAQKGSFKIIWNHETAISSNGEMCIITFMTSENAYGTTHIDITSDLSQTFNESIEEVPVTCSSKRLAFNHTHQFGEWSVIKDATCTKAGKQERVCSICKEKESQDIQKTGHHWDEGKVISEATDTKTGILLKTCHDCESTKESVIPATGTSADAKPQEKDPADNPGKEEAKPSDTKTQPAGKTVAEKTQKTPVTSTSNPIPPALNLKNVEKAIMQIKNDKDSKTSIFGTLSLKSVKSGKTNNKLKWKKVAGASGYIVYGNQCGSAYKYAKIVDTGSLSYTHKGLKKGTYYKYLVVAYKKSSSGNAVLSTSKTIHVATSGGKVGNPGKLKLDKGKVTLKKGKTFKIKAQEIAASKTIKIKRHRKIAFESSNKKIAKVSSSGKIKALRKGKCTIYVYAQNGLSKAVKITVK